MLLVREEWYGRDKETISSVCYLESRIIGKVNFGHVEHILQNYYWTSLPLMTEEAQRRYKMLLTASVEHVHVLAS